MDENSQPRGMLPTVVAALVQVAVVVGLAFAWTTGEHDSTATTVDWGLVWLILATPAALAGSFLVGRLVRHRTSTPSSRTIRAFAWTVHLTTLVLLVPTLLFALPLAAISIFIEPIG